MAYINQAGLCLLDYGSTANLERWKPRFLSLSFLYYLKIQLAFESRSKTIKSLLYVYPGPIIIIYRRTSRKKKRLDAALLYPVSHARIINNKRTICLIYPLHQWVRSGLVRFLHNKSFVSTQPRSWMRKYKSILQYYHEPCVKIKYHSQVE